MEQCCQICKNYSELTEPRKAAEECYVYGFCFKDYHGHYGSAYPVYIPNSSSPCKKFSKKPGAKELYSSQDARKRHGFSQEIHKCRKMT